MFEWWSELLAFCLYSNGVWIAHFFIQYLSHYLNIGLFYYGTASNDLNTGLCTSSLSLGLSMILVHGFKADPVTKEREIKSTEREREEGVKKLPCHALHLPPPIHHLPLPDTQLHLIIPISMHQNHTMLGQASSSSISLNPNHPNRSRWAGTILCCYSIWILF